MTDLEHENKDLRNALKVANKTNEKLKELSDNDTMIIANMAKQIDQLESDIKTHKSRANYYSEQAYNYSVEIGQLRKDEEKMIKMLIENCRLFWHLSNENEHPLGSITEKAVCFNAYLTNAGFIEDMKEQESNNE